MRDTQLLTQCARSHMAAQEGQTGWDVGCLAPPSVGCFRKALSLLKATVTIPGNSPDFETVVIFSSAVSHPHLCKSSCPCVYHFLCFLSEKEVMGETGRQADGGGGNDSLGPSFLGSF